MEVSTSDGTKVALSNAFVEASQVLKEMQRMRHLTFGIPKLQVSSSTVHTLEQYLLTKSLSKLSWHELLSVTQAADYLEMAFLEDCEKEVTSRRQTMNIATFERDLVETLRGYGERLFAKSFKDSMDLFSTCEANNWNIEICKKRKVYMCGFVLKLLKIKNTADPVATLQTFTTKFGLSNSLTTFVNILKNGLKLAAQNNDFRVVELFVKNGADSIKYDYSYALKTAAGKGHLQTVSLLCNECDETAKNEALVLSAQMGHYDTTKHLLRNGADVHFKFDSAFVYASSNGYLTVMTLLFLHGADVAAQNGKALIQNASTGHLNIDTWNILYNAYVLSDNSERLFDRDLHQALIRSVEYGQNDSVAFLLKKGASVHYSDGEAFVEACQSGWIDIAEMLLNAGAQASAQNYMPVILSARRGHAPIVDMLCLHFSIPTHILSTATLEATKYRHSDVVMILLARGASPLFSDSDALVEASKNGYTEIVDLLLDAGASVDAQDNAPLEQSVEHGHLNVVKLLCDRHVNIHANDERALSCAVEFGHTHIISFLLEKGADANVAAPISLVWCAMVGNAEAMQLLLRYCDKKKVSKIMRRALLTCAIHDHPRIANILLEFDPSISIDNAFFNAANSGSLSVVKLLKKIRNPSVELLNDSLVESVSHGHKDVAEFLLQSGAQVQTDDNIALVRSVEIARPDIVQMLLNYGADATAQENEALMSSAIFNQVHIARLLIDNHANVRARNDEPLFLSIRFENEDMIRLFIERGANVEARNNTAIVEAVNKLSIEIVEMLLKAGADARAQNDAPLFLAIINNKTDVIQTLLKYGASIDAVNARLAQRQRFY